MVAVCRKLILGAERGIVRGETLAGRMKEGVGQLDERQSARNGCGRVRAAPAVCAMPITHTTCSSKTQTLHACTLSHSPIGSHIDYTTLPVS
jgi:hypothetical protein